MMSTARIDLIFLIFVACYCKLVCCESVVYYQPEQIHISFGNNVSEIIVTWSTRNDTQMSVVEYGIGGFVKRASGSSTLFVDGGKEHRTQYIHKVLLQNLYPEETYVYHCGSELGWSAEFNFRSIHTTPNWSPRFAIYGDMGNINAQSLPRLQSETQRGLYDAILHVGDFAYDFDSNNAITGDEFMSQIESIAAYLPYMTCPGNHEEKYNFSNYRARFSMPSGADRMYYSFDIGPAHIISINTEYYYFLNYGIKSLIFQYEWLEKDLQEATKLENRQKHPWIITIGHRPMYCSDLDSDPGSDNECQNVNNVLRKGLPFLQMFGLEKLFYNYGVDLEIWAHQHSYERLWPVYDEKVYNGSYEQPYTNPKAPVHIVTGSAGCSEGVEGFVKNPPGWSAFRSSDYGYTRMKIFNTTHLYMEQVSDDKEGAIIDHMWLIKHHHGLYDRSN